MVQICLMTHFHWMTQSYGDTITVSELVSGVQRSLVERADEHCRVEEHSGVNERASGTFSIVPFQTDL